jgi:cysteinyl-tRNA synthetase
MHNGLIKVNGQKMSKSLGNSILLSDLLDKYSAEAVKFALMQTSYRNDINVTDTLFPDAEKHMTEFYTVIKAVEDSGLCAVEDYESPVAAGFDRAMSDDFNTALAIADLYGYFKKAKAFLNAKDGRAVNIVNDVKKYYAIIELFRTDAGAYLEKYAKAQDDPTLATATALAEQMQKARLEKDYPTADRIRAEIAAMGYQVMITKEGVTVKKA